MGKVIKIGETSIKPGQLVKGTIPLLEMPDGSKVGVPFLVLCGSKEGPTLFMQAGEHGTEITGMRAIGKVMNELDPQEVNGALIGIPTANPIRLQYCLYHTPQNDGATADRVRTGPDGIPGRPDGRLHDRLKYAIDSIALKYADMIFNFHADPQLGIIKYPFTQYCPNSPYIRDGETKEKIEKMIKAFGVTEIDFLAPERDYIPPAEGLVNIALSRGIPALGFELSDGRRLSGVNITVKGIKNTMKAFGMLKGEIEQQKEENLVLLPRLKRAGIITPKKGGFVHIKVDNFVKARKNDILAKIVDIYGNEVEEIKMPLEEGYVIGWICGFHGHYQAVSTGDNLCYLAEEY
jgi:predicted deacylase